MQGRGGKKKYEWIEKKSREGQNVGKGMVGKGIVGKGMIGKGMVGKGSPREGQCREGQKTKERHRGHGRHAVEARALHRAKVIITIDRSNGARGVCVASAMQVDVMLS